MIIRLKKEIKNKKKKKWNHQDKKYQEIYNVLGLKRSFNRDPKNRIYKFYVEKQESKNILSYN